MKNYYRVILGKKGKYAGECVKEGFIGLYSSIEEDLRSDQIGELKDFRSKYKPVLLKQEPWRKTMSASNACGYLYAVAKGMNRRDIVLCPDGKGEYWVGEIVSEYYYQPNEKINHRRNVEWREDKLERSLMSEPLKRLTGNPSTVSNITEFKIEIDSLLSGQLGSLQTAADDLTENPTAFALEKHLEEFLVRNWSQTELGKRYDIYEEDGEVGQQYQSDTGPIDILAISKDKRELLVVELKKGRASDSVVGQVQRYMGCVKDELASDDQIVKGVIIALEDDLRIRKALKVTQNIEFYRYEVNFRLFKNKL